MSASSTDEQVQQLLKEISRISQGGSEVTFGMLASDDLVANTFEALLGTLKAARKRGLIHFEGELLLMGQHDAVAITVVEKGGAPAEQPPGPAPVVAPPGPAPVVAPPGPAPVVAPPGPAPVVAEATEEADDAGAFLEEVATEPVVLVESAAEEMPSEDLGPVVAETCDPVSPAAEPEPVEDPAGSPAMKAVRSSEGSEEEAKGGKWNVNMSYIDHRTADPDRLEGRRGSLGGGGAASDALASASATTKRDGDKWKVDTSYIAARTEQVENLEARKENRSDTANVAAPSSTVKKEGNSWKVDTSYIAARTEQVENLEARQQQAGKVDTSGVLAAASTTTKKEGDSWKVDTSYINHRTAEVENLEAKQVASTGTVPSLPTSATVKKAVDGSWTVDTSYINHRTADTGNLTRNADGAAEEAYADPATTKYPYEQLKGVGTRPENVDPTKKELYLSDEEFQTVFGMSLTDYLRLPRWKQQNMRKAKDVF